MWKHVISITGNTAAGTTTLAKRLSRLVGWQPVYSEVYLNRNPFFINFLQEPKRWAFHNQVSFIAEYTADYQVITRQTESKNQILCLDYTIFELTVYNTAMREMGFVDLDEFRVLQDVANLFRPDWLVPDLLIYVTAGIDVLVNRIRQRGRLAEKNIDTMYLRALQTGFDHLAESWIVGPVLSIDSETNNFRDDDAVVEFISAQALRQIAQ